MHRIPVALALALMLLAACASAGASPVLLTPDLDGADSLRPSTGRQDIGEYGEPTGSQATGTIDANQPTASTTMDTSAEERLVVPASTVPPASPPAQDADDPAVVARPVPVDPPAPPPDAPPPPWAASTRTTDAGLVSTDVGCAGDLDAQGLDRFFAERIGPVLGWDYQHVTWLGGDRSLWVFQDTFVDHSGTAATLGRANFVHNAALIEEAGCFRLLHGGTAAKPTAFEPGTGTATLTTWFWPMGSEVHGDELRIVWAEMVKDAADPRPPDGLGWHPTRTWIGTYDVTTFARRNFLPAPDAGVAPIYGYAMVSDDAFTYLFGNSFEQNLSREGGYWKGPHSATRMYLARVPVGRVFDPPEYRTADGWSPVASDASPILSRHWAEFPMQPRLLDGQWVAVTAVDGYWDDRYSVDVALDPWGPWTTVESRSLAPRGGDPKMNTYHAHLVPWRDSEGELIVTVSNNARNMLRDAWSQPQRYRPMLFNSTWVDAPEPVTPPTTTTTAPTTTPPTTAAPPTAPPTSTTTTPTIAPATTSPPPSTAPPTSTTTTTTTTISTSPLPSTSTTAAPAQGE